MNSWCRLPESAESFRELLAIRTGAGGSYEYLQLRGTTCHSQELQKGISPPRASKRDRASSGVGSWSRKAAIGISGVYFQQLKLTVQSRLVSRRRAAAMT